jgi:glucosamine-6-phosphate deaminase
MNTNKPNKELSMEHLQVRVYDNRKEMGFAAGKAVASRIRELLQMQELVTMIFAAAPSQNEFLQTLVSEPGIDWKKVIALHMDEYIGLPENSPQHFRNYLEEHIINLVHPGEVHFLNGNAESIADECRRYSELLVDNPVDIVCCGIGENGHLAFNDPPVADFLDPQIVKVVELEKICRQQQVNDGCFPSLDHVPTHALSLTIPALLSGRYIYCMVPGSAKAAAVRDTLFGPITTSCPASILRRHFRVVLYLDTDSAAQL